MRCCIWCHGINSATLVNLLFLYPMKAKECRTNLLNMNLVPYFIDSECNSCQCHLCVCTHNSSQISWLAPCCAVSIVGGNAFHQAFPLHTWRHRWKGLICSINSRNEMSHSSVTHYHNLFELEPYLIIHVNLLWAALPVFILICKMSEHNNWYRSEHVHGIKI